MRTHHACFLLWFTLAALNAQMTSSITGQVVDQSKAVVAGAKVVITAVDTGAERRVETNTSGYYTVPSLTAADYTVAAEAAGFKTAVSPVFKLDAASTARIDLVLVLADARQVVEVVATPPAVETERGMTGSTVSQKELTDLPLQGRSSLDMVLSVPGVGGEMTADEPGIWASPVSAGAGLSIGGGRISNTAFLTDGAGTTGIANGRATVTFSPDTIQEIRVLTSTYSAQYGAAGSGVVSVVSRSGGSEVHGSAFWFQRNPALAARTFNTSAPPGMRRNELGATLSGPLVLPKLYDGRKRTFFFVSHEPKRYSNVADLLTRVPTAEERQGDFRNYYVLPGQTRPLLYQQMECYPSEAECRHLRRINRANATTLFPLFSANDPDPSKRGRVIPKAYLDPMVQRLMATIPLPNIPYDSLGNNYLGRLGNDGTDNRWNVKLDHTFSSRNRLSGRFTAIPVASNSYYFHRQPEPEAFPSQDSITRQVFLSDSHTVSSRIVNEFRASYLYGDYSLVPPYDIKTKNYTRDVYGFPSATDWGYPGFNISTNPVRFYGMYAPQALGFNREHQFQFSDDVTMVLGRHTIATGFDLRRQQLNIKSSGLGDVCCGLYVFQAKQTDSGNANAPGGWGGDAGASFLIGAPQSVRVRAAMVPYYYRWNNYAAYLQDDFKIKRNLTLNLGLRWEYHSPRGEKFNRQANLDLDDPVPLKDDAGRVTGYTFNYVYAGFGGSRYLEPVHKRDFEPRVGFAWSPGLGRGKLVIRGGYGISHLPKTGRTRNAIPDFGASAFGYQYQAWTGARPEPVTQSANPEFLIRVSSNPPAPQPDPNLLDIPPGGKLCAGCTPRDARVPGGDLVAFPKVNESPYIQTWSFTVQKELPKSLVLSLTYLGTKGTHLFSPLININVPDYDRFAELLEQGRDPLETVADPFGRVDTAGNLRMVTQQDLLRPYPTVGNINLASLTNSNSVYHAGTVELERRFAQGLGLRVNYAWSKSIDNTSDSNLDGTSMGMYGVTWFQDPQDLKANRSVSNFDQRHRFNAVVNAELPFGKGRRFLSGRGRVAEALAGGWSLNAIGSLLGGYPISPALGVQDYNGIPISGGSERIRPDVVPGVPIKNPRWNKSVANDVPYFNPEAFARPPYGRKGNAARTLDWARNPWRPSLNVSVLKNIFPFENRRRHVQIRGEFYNALNHVAFSSNPGVTYGLFNGTPPVSRTGTSLEGPIPYFPSIPGGSLQPESREEILGRYYNPTFGRFYWLNNSPGRLVQLALKLYW